MRRRCSWCGGPTSGARRTCSSECREAVRADQAHAAFAASGPRRLQKAPGVRGRAAHRAQPRAARRASTRAAARGERMERGRSRARGSREVQARDVAGDTSGATARARPPDWVVRRLLRAHQAGGGGTTPAVVGSALLVVAASTPDICGLRLPYPTGSTIPRPPDAVRPRGGPWPLGASAPYWPRRGEGAESSTALRALTEPRRSPCKGSRRCSRRRTPPRYTKRRRELTVPQTAPQAASPHRHLNGTQRRPM
jgi:hypothetical protein